MADNAFHKLLVYKNMHIQKYIDMLLLLLDYNKLMTKFSI